MTADPKRGTGGDDDVGAAPREAFAATLAAPPVAGSAPPPTSLRTILAPIDPDRFELGDEFARGGLGRIIQARDRRLDRQVAIKVLRQGGDEVERRFAREVLVTARLQHPSIIPVYEAGRLPSGEAFYAMRLVAGRPLGEVIAGCKTLAERLALLPHALAVAEAIAYAHAARFIHRDLKPENVLVGEFGETVVIDWGLAKDLTSGDGPEMPLERRQSTDGITRARSIIGTPIYMPPEQARGQVADERADVYALGAILYELLSGRPPYRDDQPMVVLAKVLARPPRPLASRAPGIPRELVAITEKAMARRRRDRYPTARELAEDLRRFQTGQLVAAHAYTPAQLVARWIRRHAAAVIAGAIAVAVVAAGSGASIRRVVAERDRGGRELDAARAAGAAAGAAEIEATGRADGLRLVLARASLGRDPTRAVAWLKRLSPSFHRWDEARVAAIEAEQRGVAELYRGHERDVFALAFSPDGRRLASGSGDRSVRLWDLERGGGVVLTGHGDDVTGLAFSPDGATLASSSADGTVRVWTPSTGTSITLTGHEGAALAVAFAPDGKRLASSGGGGEVRLWDLARGGCEVFHDHEKAVLAVSVSPDGEALASAGEDGAVRVRDLRARRSRVLARLPMVLSTLAYAPDGKRLAVAGADGRIHLYDVGTGAERLLEGHTERVFSVAFSADGRRLVSASGDSTMRLWDVAAGNSRVLRGPDRVFTAAISPDGRRLASGGSDRLVRLWRSETGEQGEAPLEGEALRAWIGRLTRAEVDANGELVAGPVP